MTRLSPLWMTLFFLCGGLFACGGGGDSTAPPTTGTLEINVSTTGVDFDADGFLLTMDGGAPQVIPANGILTLSSLPPGNHTLAVSGLAFNCDVAAAPTSASISLGNSTRVDVQASCTPYLRNAIVYISEQFVPPEVMVMRADGSRQQRLTSDSWAYASPVVSPDGQSIAVHSARNGGGIYLLDRFGNGVRTLVSRSNWDVDPAWSPDGTRIAFESGITGPVGFYTRIFIVNRDGSGLRQLTPETTDYTSDYGPSWSPDGTRLVFSRFGELTIINPDGFGLTSLGIPGAYPAWSPDGTQIAYDLRVDGIRAIYLADANGTNVRRITTPAEGDDMPRWSPDSRQLVFSRVEGGMFHLFKVNADGTAVTKLSTVAQHETWANWSPNF